MNVEWMRGCATALVTPFKSDGGVDVERMRALVERQCEGGVRVLVPCGTTGESVTMSEDESRRVISTTVEVARARGARVIAGAGSNSTAHAVSNARAARDAGADAVLIVAPYYNKPTQEGLYRHFRAVAEAVAGLPVVLYNVPGRTSSNIAAETTLRLARDVENVVAVKEASGNLAQIMEIIRQRPEGFLVLSGDDAMTFALMALGADGLVSVASNEAPGPHVEDGGRGARGALGRGARAALPLAPSDGRELRRVEPRPRQGRDGFDGTARREPAPAARARHGADKRSACARC